MLKSLHVLSQPSDAELLAYVFFKCSRKKRVGWKLPAEYFISIQEWIPRSSIKDHEHLVNYSIHKHFKENMRMYMHRYSWTSFDKITEVVNIKSLPICIIEHIYTLVAKNEWDLDSISEDQNPKLNYLKDTHVQTLKTYSLFYKIRVILILLNLCLFSLLGTKLTSFVKILQQVQLAEKIEVTVPEILKTSSTPFEHGAFDNELSEGVQCKQKSFQDWVAVKSILEDCPGIQIDNCMLKNEKQMLNKKPFNQKIITISGKWYLNTIDSKDLSQPTSLFEQMMEQLRSVPTVEQIHCMRYDFISSKEIQFAVKVDFRPIIEPLSL